MPTNRIDIHSHILPGLDDGAKDMEESKAMLQIAYSQGIRGIIATPHYHHRKYHADINTIQALAGELQKEAKKIASNFYIYSGQELFYREELTDMLDRGELLTLAGSRYILVEFSPDISYGGLFQAVRRITDGGYVPVLAHVERYRCLRERERPEEVILAGACLQMNYRSLMSGLNRLAERNWCRRMVLQGNVHFLGTDMHGLIYRPPKTEEAYEWLCRKAGRRQAIRLTWGNPVALLENKFLT